MHTSPGLEYLSRRAAERVSLARRVAQLAAEAAPNGLYPTITLGQLWLQLGCTVSELHAAVRAARAARLINTGAWTLSQHALSQQLGAAAVMEEHDGREFTWFVEAIR